MQRVGVGALLVGAALLVAACGSGGPDDLPQPGDPNDDPAPSREITLPPERGVLSYQLGGGYDPPAGTDLVARDSTDEPAEGLYSVCYVNGFQTQPGTDLEEVDALLLHDGDDRVVDPDWPDEALYDTSTPENRRQVAELVARDLDVCAEKGFDAVDLDNLDSFTRSRGMLELDDNVETAQLIVQAAHERDLAVGQKNAAELTVAFAGTFDFALVEECAQYDECASYLGVYGPLVYAVEYTDAQDVPFERACEQDGDRTGFTLRDRDLLPAGEAEHVEEPCP